MPVRTRCGLHRYPARARNCSDSPYDGRTRPAFLKAVTPGSKRIVIVLDQSDMMVRWFVLHACVACVPGTCLFVGKPPTRALCFSRDSAFRVALGRGLSSQKKL